MGTGMWLLTSESMNADIRWISTRWILILCHLNYVQIGFREAGRKAKPVLLEPIMKVEVVTPDQYMEM